MRSLFIAVCLLVTATLASAQPVDLSVNGQPPLGAFGVNNLQQVLECAQLGMNLVYTYRTNVGRQQLDLKDPIGQAVAEHHMKVMYMLAGRFTRVRLASDLTPDQTTIPVIGEEAGSMDAFPASGVLHIEQEQITYRGHTRQAFTGCRRGANGTTPAMHRAGLLLCNSEKLKEEILAIKDSPNLWGFWLVDDARPEEGDSLREMSRVIRLYDRRADGTPYHHVIVMGVGGMNAMANFSPGVADAIGTYPYPYREGKLNLHLRRVLNYAVIRARSLQPDIGLIGIYQAFRNGTKQWRLMPTPAQMREDILSFFKLGAAGVMAFIYDWQRPGGQPWGLDSSPAACQMVAQTYAEIRTGKIKPAPITTPAPREWFRVITGPEAKPDQGTAVIDYSNPKQVAALQKATPAGRLVVQATEADGVSYPVRMVVQPYTKGAPARARWPGLTVTASHMSTSDWSKFSYLEQPVYNPGANTISPCLRLADSEGGGWDWPAVPIPPHTPVLLRLPLAEAAMVTNLHKIRDWMIWYKQPREDYVLNLGSPVLVK